jgi:fructokinase
VDEFVIPTTSPDEALEQVIAYFRRQAFSAPIVAVGIASFGPIDRDLSSPSYGFVTNTPKSGWRNTDVVGCVRSALGVPVAWDTDVNGAALAESRWGAGRGLKSLVYVTIGTGIGGGAVYDGTIARGTGHPEMGHVIVERIEGDDFPGVCLSHTNCIEGMASGRAVAGRVGHQPEALANDHPVWDLEVKYLAQGLRTITYVLAPDVIVLGGGVMRQPMLLPKVRAQLVVINNGYVDLPHMNAGIDRYVVAPVLGTRSGVIGALALAEAAATGSDPA